MKTIINKLLVLALTIAAMACEVDTYGPGPDLNDLKSGTVNLGGDTYYNITANVKGGNLVMTDNATIDKINLNAGSVSMSGNSAVLTDINVKSGSTLTMAGNSKVNKINMSGGSAHLFGNATVDSDLNFNAGSMTIGDASTPSGQVRIKGNFNVSAIVNLEWGELVVEGDLNGIGNIVKSSNATLTVLGNQNP